MPIMLMYNHVHLKHVRREIAYVRDLAGNKIVFIRVNKINVNNMDGTTFKVFVFGPFWYGPFLHLGHFLMGRFCIWAILGLAVFVWDALVFRPFSPESLANYDKS